MDLSGAALYQAQVEQTKPKVIETDRQINEFDSLSDAQNAAGFNNSRKLARRRPFYL